MPPTCQAKEQERFEQWYATHAFDYESAPIGSRDCALQWAAWLARAEIARNEEVRSAASFVLSQLGEMD